MSELPAKLYSAEQVRRLDACAINEQGIPGYELMQRAGNAVFSFLRQGYPQAQHWVLLCGAGNNAGDGYVVARLALEAGMDVTLYALKSPDKLLGDALTAANDWRSAGGLVSSWPPADADPAPDLLVDALLGTGLDRRVEGHYRDAIEWMNARPCPKLAVDIPSGLHADTGCVMGCAVKADATVSFIGLKQGLLTCDGPDHAGELVFDSLKVPEETYQAVPDSGLIIRENDVYKRLLPRARNAHKGHYGHLLVVGGGKGMAGAARLAGEAALRCGAGLVSVATHRAHAASLNLARPELMVTGVKTTEDLQALLDNCTVLACGPGLGTRNWSRRLLEACLDCELPLVLDADGLNLLAGKPVDRAQWILTPHPAEAARLLNCTTADIQADRIGSTRQLATQYQAVCVLKGCGTVVAQADGRFAVCPLGNPGMATAGSGDVLTGVIAGLLAQGHDCWEAACLGVVIHAAAGDLAALHLGERGMLAGDITDAIPQILG